MKSAMKPALKLVFPGVVVVLIALSAVGPTVAAAQTASQGNNAVYNSSGNCSSCLGSGAFIDASVFADTTFCKTIYDIPQPTGYSTAVIDARGLNSSISGFSMTCAAGTTPWNNGTTYLNKPSTILLPAGTIVIPKTWVLPNNTVLIGVGDALPSTSSASSTTIQACTSCSFSGSDMIDLGTSILCPMYGDIPVCNSVSVENLVLDGQGRSLNGIVNTNAQINLTRPRDSYQGMPSGMS